MELAIQTVTVTEPEFAFRAGALASTLLSFAEGIVVADVFTVRFLGDCHPLAGGLEVDAVLIVVEIHKVFLRSICLERRKPSWPLHFGNRNPTTAPSEIFLRSGSAASRSKGSCLYVVVPSSIVEPSVISRCGA